jgi:hypothetical protein
MQPFEDSKNVSKTKLLEVAEKLKSILEPLGYSFDLEYNAAASAGPFANGFFKRDGLQIGIIWREVYGLGGIVYENEKFSVDHEDIMKRFKHSKQQKFIFDKKKWKAYSRDGGDVIDAVIFDMKLLIDDLLAADKTTINQALKDAYKIRQKFFS